MNEYKLTHNQISFCYTDASTFEEREFHAYHEILYIINGEAALFTEQFQQTAEKDTLILIPKGHYHYFQPKDSAPFIRLKIGFPYMPEPLEELLEIRVVSDLCDTTRFLLQEICSCLEKDTESKKLTSYGAFLMLLPKLCGTTAQKPAYIRDNEHFLSKAIFMIHENLANTLSAEALAEALCDSPSTLTHAFRKEMGISLHRYITEKRMIHAHRLITEGALPTKIYHDCGYTDYSSFYKAYIKMFGCPPSTDT